MAMTIKAMPDGATMPQVSTSIFMTMAGTIGAGEDMADMDMEVMADTATTTHGTGTDGTTGAGEVTMDMEVMVTEDMATDTDGADIITLIAVTETDITTELTGTDTMETDIPIMAIEVTPTTEVDAATTIETA